MSRSWLKRARSSPGSSVSAGVGSRVGGGAGSSSWGLEAREAQGEGATRATDRASRWDPTPGKSISPASWPWDGVTGLVSTEGRRAWPQVPDEAKGQTVVCPPPPPAVFVYPSPPPCIISFRGLGSSPPTDPPAQQLLLPPSPGLSFPPGSVWIRLSGPSRQTRAAHKPPRRKSVTLEPIFSLN